MIDEAFEPTLEDTHRVLQLILYAQRGITLEADRLLNSEGYTRAHFRILYIIEQLPGTNLKSLVAGIGVSHQAVSQLLGKLIKDKNVFQRNDSSDNRKKLLFLTDKGRVLQRATYQRQAAVIRKALQEIGEEGTPIFLRAMESMVSERDREIVETLRRSISGRL